MSRARPACAAPETMLTIGMGSSGTSPPSSSCQSGRPAPRAPATLTATDTASTELAPRRPSPGVPSRSSMTASIRGRSAASMPTTAGARTSFTFRTAALTPNPPKRSPWSRNSTASYPPVEAPDGTTARPSAPSARPTRQPTVGRPARVEGLPGENIIHACGRHWQAQRRTSAISSSFPGGDASNRSPNFLTWPRSSAVRYSAGDLPSTRASMRQAT